MRVALARVAATALRTATLRRWAASAAVTKAVGIKDVGALKHLDVDLTSIPADRVRNLCIIAHIDHGKSTLADRLLEVTGTISSFRDNKQVLDKLKVERERGITVKAQTASMFVRRDGELYMINLIDTPGHVDFSYEVSRSMAACQGALLVVDALQGIQAQTLANYHLATSRGLTIIPVLNKVDLPDAQPERVLEEIRDMLGCDVTHAKQVSAKSGLNVASLIDVIIDHIPPPTTAGPDKPLRALLFDSWFDTYRGVVCLVNIFQGTLKKGDRLLAAHSDIKYEALDVGVMYPEQVVSGLLRAGQVGYLVCGMKTAKEARVGDTFLNPKDLVEPLPGFQAAKSMLFAGIFPADSSEFEKLADAIDRLTLNDNSVSLQKETSSALGQGWRIGFLGLLHMDVFRQRLEEEFETSVIVTNPTVPYQIVWPDGTNTFVKNPDDFPELHRVADVLEPTIRGTMIFPASYLGDIMRVCEDRRGVMLVNTFLNEDRVCLVYRLPLNEVVTDFYDQIKSVSSGYCSFDYEEDEYQSADLVMLNILLNGKPVDALATIVHRERAVETGKALVHKLKDLVHRQLFEIVIQASIGVNKIVARESLSALRKNVTAKCYGGDVSRKMKLLNKQKEGKKKMKMIGNVELPHETFQELLKR